MTTQEAIKSGKHFRRKEWGIWCTITLWLDAGHLQIIEERTGDIVEPYVADILAEDWEIKP